MIALIIAGALLFGKVMTMIEIPQRLTEWIIANNLTPLAFVLAMNVLMFFLGMMLETISIILLTMPLVAPVLSTLNIDPIWYGIVLTVNLTLALVTPPVGMDLYVIAGLQKDVHISEVIQGVFPFILLMIGVLALVIAFPVLSTWLPSVMR
jgi:C4-dicarboxylate transporter DctM subunit